MFPFTSMLPYQKLRRFLSHTLAAHASMTPASRLLSTKADDALTQVTVLSYSLSARNVRRFLRELSDHFVPGRQIIVSFENVRRIDSAGLGAIITAAQQAADCGAEIKLCAVQPRLRTVFERVELHKSVDILNSCEESVAAFATAG